VSKRKGPKLPKPIWYRTLTIDFVNRTFGFDGQVIRIESDAVSIPVLSTEHPILPKSGPLR
jgi:hypothetical protein